MSDREGKAWPDNISWQAHSVHAPDIGRAVLVSTARHVLRDAIIIPQAMKNLGLLWSA